MKKDLLIEKQLIEEQAYLANERTMLAYIRTAFAAFILGFALLQFGKEIQTLIALGFAVLSIGAVLLIGGGVHFILFRNHIKKRSERNFYLSI